MNILHALSRLPLGLWLRGLVVAIAVIEQVRLRGGPSVEVQQPLPLPAGVEDSAVGGYHSGAEPELWLLLVFGAAVIVVMHRRRRESAC